MPFLFRFSNYLWLFWLGSMALTNWLVPAPSALWPFVSFLVLCFFELLNERAKRFPRFTVPSG